jgi:hypothetical protein
MRAWLPIALLVLPGHALAAERTPTAKDIEAFESTRVMGPYVTYDSQGQGYAEFAPNVVVRGSACEKTERARVFRCRYESHVSDWGRSDGPWTTREVLLRRDRDGCWREVA